MNIKHSLCLVSIVMVNLTCGMDLVLRDAYNNVSEKLTYGLDYLSWGKRGFEPMKDSFNFISFKRKVARQLAHGTNINCVSPDGLWTPLSRAAYRGDLWQCKILLKFGADVNAAHANFTSLMGVLMCEEAYKRKKVFNFLISRGADINQRSLITGMTPLLLNAVSGHQIPDSASNVKFLLMHGANPFKCDFRGNHALILEVRNIVKHPAELLDRVGAILENVVEKRNAVFIFLCCLRRIKNTGSMHERCLADAMFQNRKKIIGQMRRGADLAALLKHTNDDGHNAHEFLKSIYRSHLADVMDPLRFLDPEQAIDTQLLLIERMARRQVVQANNCPLQ